MTNFVKCSDDEFLSQTMLNVSHCFGSISTGGLRKAESSCAVLFENGNAHGSASFSIFYLFIFQFIFQYNIRKPKANYLLT